MVAVKVFVSVIMGVVMPAMREPGLGFQRLRRVVVAGQDNLNQAGAQGALVNLADLQLVGIVPGQQRQLRL